MEGRIRILLTFTKELVRKYSSVQPAQCFDLEVRDHRVLSGCILGRKITLANVSLATLLSFRVDSLRLICASLAFSSGVEKRPLEEHS